MRTDAIDPYTPHSGDSGYRAERYDLAIEYRVATNRLTATATITATADTDGPLDAFAFDLHGLTVDGVTVDGVRARKYSTSTHKLTVTPQTPVDAGAPFTIAVRYRGAPKPVRSPWGTLGWEELADGVIVASQPVGAPSWFPCNDLPTQKATYRIQVTCESEYDVLANGALVGRESARGGTRWVFEVTEPMATYLATVQIGRYRTHRLRNTPVPTTLHHPADLQHSSRVDFGRLRDMLTLFIDRFGPYPFAEYAVVVTDDELEIPLEAHGLAVFGRNHVDGHHGSDRLIAHELAHQWFGNSLTLGRWQDIWLHEGFACYAEWLWAEEHDGVPADQNAREHRERIAREPLDLVVADPGQHDLFDDRVYKRGALALHAVRRLIGDDRFFTGLRALTARHRHGTVSTTDVIAAFAGTTTPGDGAAVRSAIAQWVDARTVPER
ncbi:M1 family metallopeptidase [Curtobacterium sp. Leaf261]|uniref:M1 family metallopeptidase n=1 Tax=Curtobacterium sp. Leaf261 TaxID=1736311 RepID=UPI000A9D50F4|nr:M1 family metallopeptidase [Curtobacterium sp. Leaf261]